MYVVFLALCLSALSPYTLADKACEGNAHLFGAAVDHCRTTFAPQKCVAPLESILALERLSECNLTSDQNMLVYDTLRKAYEAQGQPGLAYKAALEVHVGKGRAAGSGRIVGRRWLLGRGCAETRLLLSGTDPSPPGSSGGAIRTLTLFFYFYYGIHSLMFGGYPPTAIGYPPTAIGYPPTAIGYTPTAIVGRIGNSEFFFFHYGTPWGSWRGDLGGGSEPKKILCRRDRVKVSINACVPQRGSGEGSLVHPVHAPGLAVQNAPARRAKDWVGRVSYTPVRNPHPGVRVHLMWPFPWSPDHQNGGWGGCSPAKGFSRG